MPTTAAPTTTFAPVVKVNGSAVLERWLDQLTVLRIDRSLGTVGRATFRFVDVGYGLSSSSLFKLGAEVQVEQHGGQVPLFKGEVTGLSLEQSADAVPELVVTVDDPAHRLARGTHTRTFLHATYGDVVQTLGGGNGVTVAVTTAGGLGTVHEYQLQACSDLAYLNHIVERTGTSWWVGTDGKLQVGDPAAVTSNPVALTLGESLQRFSVRASDLHPRKVSVTGWDPDRQQQVTGNASSTRTAESNFVADFPGRKAATGPIEAQVADQSPLTDSEAAHLATALLTEAATSAVVARGTCLVDSTLGPAASVQVKDAGPASGTYRVTAVQHVYNAAGFLTHFTAGPYRPAGLVDLVSSDRAEAVSSLDGLVPGVVTDVADPDQIGRVKVKYPAAGGTIDSPWARVATLGAGQSRGMVFHPEVNDEVLVAFQGGDPRQPVVLGSLFSKKIGLPDKDKSNIEQSKVKFRRITSREGHLIELGDGPGDTEHHILLSLKDAKHRLRLGKDRFDIEVDRKPVLIKSGQAKFEISAQGDITIEGANITIKAQQNFKVEALGIDVQAKAKLGVKAAVAEVKADATATVQASGMLALKGGTVAIN